MSLARITAGPLSMTVTPSQLLQRFSLFVLSWGYLLHAGPSACGDDSSLERIEAAQPHMGTEFSIVVYAADAASARHAVDAAFARIAELDQRLSDYRSDSEINLLCAGAPHAEWMPVSSDLWHLLSLANQLSRQSDGAFDVTVGPLTKLWRRARRRHEVPPAAQLAQARQAVGYQYLQLDLPTRRVRLTRAGMRVDLGAIAKGYAAEQAGRILEAHGLRRWLVDAGGDLAAGDGPPGNSGWRIAIAPLEANEPPTRWLQIARSSVATSGDFWQYFELDGQRYSHILDPRTGMGVRGRSSVTVIARHGELSDALASTLTVLPPERGLELAARYSGTEALIIRERSEEAVEWTTPGWQSYLVEMPPQLE